LSWFARLVYSGLVWKERRDARRERTAFQTPDSAKNSRHLATGTRGETLAYWHLRGAGYVVVARNRRPSSRRGELDIVAWDGPVLAFVEVKTRSGTLAGPPEWAVTADQKTRIVQSAHEYMRHLKYKPEAYRFDIAGVAWVPENGYRVRLIKGAFKE
jgi:putative endonuclease